MTLCRLSNWAYLTHVTRHPIALVAVDTAESLLQVKRSIYAHCATARNYVGLDGSSACTYSRHSIAH